MTQTCCGSGSRPSTGSTPPHARSTNTASPTTTSMAGAMWTSREWHCQNVFTQLLTHDHARLSHDDFVGMPDYGYCGSQCKLAFNA